MSTRRPRVKALANLSVKRPAKSDKSTSSSASASEITDKTLKLEEPKNITEFQTSTSPITTTPDSKNDSIQNASNRRRIKPAVNIPSRKTKPTSNLQKQTENIKPSIEKNSSEVEIEENEIITKTDDKYSKLENNENILESPKSASILEESIKSPNTFNDSQFKSPRNLPTTNRTLQSAVKSIPKENNLGLTIIADIQPLGVDEPLKCPMSPTKIRQRIRPTPFFGIRRNSIQGNNSDAEDEPRRPRHHSTSSSHSNQNISAGNKTYSNSGFFHNRIRTDSACSNVSDISLIKDVMNTKQRRGMRSEESYRMVEARRDFKNRFSGGTPDKTQLTMYDMIHYNPNSNHMKNPALKDGNERRISANHSVSSFTIKKDSRTQTPILKEDEAMPVPQLKIGPNGEIIIDEKSLVIETTGEKEARETLANSDIIYDDEFSGSQGFYKRQQRTKDWKSDETIKFYRCLQITGTDFSMMVSLFPNRTRRDLKLKFKKEERSNPILINKALLHPKIFNIEELQLELEKDEALSLERKKLIDSVKQKGASEKKTTLKKMKSDGPQKRVSRSQRQIIDGDFVYQHEDVLSKVKTKKGKKNEMLQNINKLIDNKSDLSNNNEIQNNNVGENEYIPNLDSTITTDYNTQSTILSDLNYDNDLQQIKNNNINKLPSFDNVMPSQNNKFKDFDMYVNSSGKHFVPADNNDNITETILTDNSRTETSENLNINNLENSQNNISHISLSESIAKNIIDDNFNFDDMEVIFEIDSQIHDSFTFGEEGVVIEKEKSNKENSNEKLSTHNVKEKSTVENIEEISTEEYVEEISTEEYVEQISIAENVEDKSAENEDDTSIAENEEDTSIAENEEDTSIAENEEDTSIAENEEDTSIAENEEDTSIAENVEEISTAENVEYELIAENVEEISTAENVEENSIAEHVENESIAENVEEISTAEIVEDESIAGNVEEISTAENVEDESIAENVEEISTAEIVEDESIAGNVEEISTAENVEYESIAENVEEISTAENVEENSIAEHVENESIAENVEEISTAEIVEDESIAGNVEEISTAENVEYESIAENVEYESTAENVEYESIAENIEVISIAEIVEDESVTENVTENSTTDNLANNSYIDNKENNLNTAEPTINGEEYNTELKKPDQSDSIKSFIIESRDEENKNNTAPVQTIDLEKERNKIIDIGNILHSQDIIQQAESLSKQEDKIINDILIQDDLIKEEPFELLLNVSTGSIEDCSLFEIQAVQELEMLSTDTENDEIIKQNRYVASQPKKSTFKKHKKAIKRKLDKISKDHSLTEIDAIEKPHCGEKDELNNKEAKRIKRKKSNLILERKINSSQSSSEQDNLENDSIINQKLSLIESVEDKNTIDNIVEDSKIDIDPDSNSQTKFELDNLNSLVVVEIQDALNADKTSYEIYQMCHITGKLGDKLDLPQAVIEYIASMKPDK